MINLTKKSILRKLFPLALIFCLALAPILGLQTTGDRNGPPPPFFSITLLVPDNIPERVDWVDLIAEKLELIGIGITDIDVDTWANILPRTFDYPGPYPIPTYAGGGYDILFVSLLYWKSPDWTVEGVFDTPSIVPNGYNYYQYSSATYDNVFALHQAECIAEDRIPYTRQLQEILFEDLPSIPIIYPRVAYPMLENVTAIDLCLWHTTYQPMDRWSILGDLGLEYAWNGTLNICHPYSQGQYYYDKQWLLQIYDSLIYCSNCSGSMHWAPRIATSYSQVNCTVWTVYMDTNAKWADGTSVTSHDVAFSYQAMMNPTLNSPYAALLDGYLDSVSAIDDYTVEFVLSEPYTFAERLLSYPLIPKHIWKAVDYADWETQAYTWATTDPSKIFGCGPFKLEEVNVSTGSVKLNMNAYFADLINFDGPNFETVYFIPYLDKATALSALSMGFVDVVDGHFELELSELSIPGTTYYIVPTLEAHEMGINMEHPYLGTGASCPIPGPDSAKHIRKAICNVIPRETIINTIFGGLGEPGLAPCPEGCMGFNADLMPCDFSTDIAKDHMRAAGFVYPEDITTTPETETETETTTETETETETTTPGFIGIAFPTFVAILALAGGCTIIIRRRLKV